MKREDLKNIGGIAVSIVLACIPVVVCLWFMRQTVKVGILDAKPTLNDSFGYWMAAKTFALAGFNGGYFTINEVPAPASFTHFYAYGPGYAIFFGLLGRLLSWQPYSIAVWNVVAISAAFFIYFRLTGASLLRQVIVVITAITSPWLMAYLPINMMEATSHITGIVIAGLLAFLYKQNRINYLWGIGALVFILLVSWPRLTWAPFTFVWAGVVTGQTKRTWKVIGLAVVAVVASWGMSRILSQTAAPAPGSFLAEILSVNNPNFLLALRNQMLNSMTQLNALYGEGAVKGSTMWSEAFFVLLQSAIVVAILILWWIGRLIFKLRKEGFWKIFSDGLIVAGLGGTLIAVPLLYGPVLGARVVSSIMFASALFIFASFKNYFMQFGVALVILTGIITLPRATSFFTTTIYSDYRRDLSEPREFARMAQEAGLQYDPSKSGWCNTVYMNDAPSNYGSDTFIDMPAGFGYSFGTAPRLPLKSQYVLLYKDKTAPYEKSLNLELLSQSEKIGKLYRNLDSQCN